MTWPLAAAIALFGGLAVLLVLGRRNVPADLESWCRKLTSDSAALRHALELQVAADGAMAKDALRRAGDARDGLAYTEAVRLADVAFRVLESAGADRVTRLRGMALCVRMASASAVPVSAVGPRIFRLVELRALFSAGLLVHHLLVSAGERLLLKLMLLRFGCRLAIRAMRGAVVEVHVDPAAVRAWARCDDVVADWTVGLDPAHVEAFRAILATAEAARHVA